MPKQSWYSKGIYSILLAGLIPFAVIFIELLFIFRNLWQDKSGFYYAFGFLSVVSLVCIFTVIEVTIVAIYVQLCAEVSLNLWMCLILDRTEMNGPKIELPLVVAIRLCWRQQRLLDFRPLHMVLFHSTSHPGFHLHHAFFELQLSGLCCIWAVNRYGGILDSVCFRSKNLWVC